MVFGWGKKETQKKEPTPTLSKEKEIKLSEIQSVVDDIQSLRKRTIIAEVKAHRKKIEKQLNEILKIIKDLERHNLKVDDVDKHLQILVVRGKKQVIDIIKKEASEKLPEIKSYDDVESLNTLVLQILKRIGDVLGRQSRVIHIFAKKHAGKLKAHLSILNSDRDEIQTLIDTQVKINQDISKISEKIEAYNQLKKLLDDTKERIVNFKDAIEQYNKKEKEIVQELSDIKAGTEYSKYIETHKKLDALSSEKNIIQSSIDLQFTKISRPLSRYAYVSSLEKPQKLLLEQLIDNPFNVLKSENKDTIIKILFGVRKGVEGRSISVKDFEKSLSNLDETIEKLDSFISQIQLYANKKVDLEKELETFDSKELKQKENFLTKTNNDRSDAESKIKELEHEVSKITKQLPKFLMEIEFILQKISSTKYKVRVEGMSTI